MSELQKARKVEKLRSDIDALYAILPPYGKKQKIRDKILDEIYSISANIKKLMK